MPVAAKDRARHDLLATAASAYTDNNHHLTINTPMLACVTFMAMRTQSIHRQIRNCAFIHQG